MCHYVDLLKPILTNNLFTIIFTNIKSARVINKFLIFIYIIHLYNTFRPIDLATYWIYKFTYKKHMQNEIKWLSYSFLSYNEKRKLKSSSRI